MRNSVRLFLAAPSSSRRPVVGWSVRPSVGQSETFVKNPAYGRQSISQPMRIVAPIPKNPASKAKFAKKKTFFARRSYTLYKQKFSYLRPLLFVTFPQGFRKSKKFGHWTSGSGGKKTFKRSEQMKKNP